MDTNKVLPIFSLRELTPSDQEFLWNMVHAAVFVSSGSPPPPREVIFRPELARYGEDWGRPGDLGYVAIEEPTRRPIGAAWLRLLTGSEKGYGYVDDLTPELSIAVLPEFRGMGVGKALLERLISAARLRFPAVSLSVSNNNPAVRLYQNLGFGVIADDGATLTMMFTFGSK